MQIYTYEMFLFVLDNYELFHRTNICIANLKLFAIIMSHMLLDDLARNEKENSPHECIKIQITIMIINAE